MKNKHDISYYLLIVLIVIIASLLAAGIIYYCLENDKSTEHISAIDGKNYVIRDQGTVDTKQEAANYLSQITTNVDDLVKYMKDNNKPNKEVADRLANRWRKCFLRETSTSETSAAYTINKGEEMRICIRKDDHLENMNTTMFVILHELAHMMSVSYGHNSEFSNNFSYIVHLASELDIYKPEDFVNNPTEYCGVIINTTPCSQGTCSGLGHNTNEVEAFENFGKF